MRTRELGWQKLFRIWRIHVESKLVGVAPQKLHGVQRRYDVEYLNACPGKLKLLTSSLGFGTIKSHAIYTKIGALRTFMRSIGKDSVTLELAACQPGQTVRIDYSWDGVTHNSPVVIVDSLTAIKSTSRHGKQVARFNIRGHSPSKG